MLRPRASHAAALLLLLPLLVPPPPPTEALVHPCRDSLSRRLPLSARRAAGQPGVRGWGRGRGQDQGQGSGLAALPPAADLPALLLSPEAVLPPLNVATEPWVRSLVWTDFRAAVALFVAAPLALLGWAVAACRPVSLGGRGGDDKAAARPDGAEAALRYLTSYWQASSLLLITVALNVQGSGLGVVTGLAAQAMIVASLWWWSDLNAEVGETLSSPPSSSPSPSQPRPALLSAFAAWRLAATAAAAAGVVVQVPFQPCASLPSLEADPACAAWLEPPRLAAGLAGVAPSAGLGLAAHAAVALYGAVLMYYLAVLLPGVGRLGRAPRPGLMDRASPIGAWRWLGFIEGQTPPGPEGGDDGGGR